jgi:hypothetical protein
MPYRIIVLLLLIGCIGCQTGTEDETEVNTENKADSLRSDWVLERIDGMPISMGISSAEAVVYDKCGEGKKELMTYYRGDSVVFSNQLMREKRSERNSVPWLKVVFGNNQMGWIDGNAVGFDAKDNEVLTDRVLIPKAANLLGANLAQQLQIYNREVAEIQTLSGFRLLVTRAQTISDSIAIKLNQHSGELGHDFFWLNQITPGLLLHYLEEQQKYTLYRDFRIWQEWTRKTPTVTDDDFIAIFLKVYQTDSIEYAFYDWEMPIDKGVSCSLLGSEIHSEVLQEMTIMRDTSGYFSEEIVELKQNLVNDISLSNRYWLMAESVLEELDSILAKNYTVLNDNDQVELKNRRQILKKYAENGIEMGLFDTYEQKPVQ